MNDQVDKLLDQWAEQKPEVDCSGLDVVVRVQNLAKMLRRDEDEALEKLGLKMWEYDVLAVLLRQGAPYALPAKQLALEALLSTGAMTNRVDRLEARQFVEREDDPEDRRSVRVRLTRQGRELADLALDTRAELAAKQVDALSAREKQTVANALKKVLDAVEAEVPA